MVCGENQVCDAMILERISGGCARFSVRLLVASAVIAVVICGCGQEEEELDRTKSGAFKLEKTCTHSIAC